jgi:hypothetical protein
MIDIRDNDPIDVRDMIMKMNMKTQVYQAHLQYTHDYINSHRPMITPKKEDIPMIIPHEDTPPMIIPHEEAPMIKSHDHNDKYKMKDFMTEYYPDQRRIPISEIQKLYKTKKFIQINQKEMTDLLQNIGYKVVNCSHKLIAILDDGFK